MKEAITSRHPINKILIQDGVKKQQLDEILKNAKKQKLIVQTVPKTKL
ncbi:23S rRNA (guanosine(2251)-2'-O)-methyltransferase RlmB, partial [Klebsiella pneumoniae]|nr:23S rRNA (guanosine(2251)-2'-O)-methyltransferase RlmB [Klebsiella pneumoniae]